MGIIDIQNYSESKALQLSKRKGENITHWECPNSSLFTVLQRQKVWTLLDIWNEAYCNEELDKRVNNNDLNDTLNPIETELKHSFLTPEFETKLLIKNIVWIIHKSD